MRLGKLFIYFSFFLIMASFVALSCRSRDKAKSERLSYTEYLAKKGKKTVDTKKTTRKTTHRPAGNSFYDRYSRKMGVDFNGTEDPELIKEVETWIGTPYKYGGYTKRGTDCSGFVKTVYKKVYNIDLNRSAKDLVKNARLVSKNRLRFGDLVFFKINKPRVSHVGIYLGENKFIHASSSRGVVVSDLTATYYTKYFYKGGRVNN